MHTILINQHSGNEGSSLPLHLQLLSYLRIVIVILGINYLYCYVYIYLKLVNTKNNLKIMILKRGVGIDHCYKSNETRWKRHTCQHCYKK